jgi:hypothetical protein
MPAVVYQCPTCKNLVTVSAAMVDADRAGLVCASCGATTWLPGAQASRGDVIDVEVRPSSAPSLSPTTAAGASAIVPRAAQAVAGAGAWSHEERERVDGRVAKLTPATPGQAEVHASFHKLLDAWASDVEHKAFVKKSSLAGELAFAGQLYRAVLDAAPLDPFAKRAQGEILTVAMATMSASRDLGSTEKSSGARNAFFLVVAVVLMAVVVFVGVKLLKNAVGGDRIDAVDQ